jgi:hypothetical protein
MRQAKRCGKVRVRPTGTGTLVTGGTLLAGLLLGGCVVVKPYQREHLAERCMASGMGDPTELKFRSHWEGSRQGGEGGFGTAGGGCGCN